MKATDFRTACFWCLFYLLMSVELDLVLCPRILMVYSLFWHSRKGAKIPPKLHIVAEGHRDSFFKTLCWLLSSVRLRLRQFSLYYECQRNEK